MSDTSFVDLQIALDDFMGHVITSWGINLHHDLSAFVATADLKHTGVGHAASLATPPCRSELAAMACLLWLVAEFDPDLAA